MIRKIHILFLAWLFASSLWSIPAFSQPSVTEQEAMDFLYRYLSLPDQADYPRSFYLKNVRLSLEARQNMPWGRSIPEKIFKHFVLPVRVNNENLDNSREVFYHELKDRVGHLGMKEAVLEVNHWCHEKVTYRPSDARTSSPLASVKTAYGRCGEESTFLVAALRSVGIPARQVYTPRWAHTDDNHAWVEAWADGRWWFLGACEPEPVLNLGWFNESASRGMLMHTKVFGAYDGSEEKISRNPYYTEINVTDNYAPTTTREIRVVDPQGRPVAGASVEFKIYNYAEFYTVALKVTDSSGKVTLTAGRGDLLVWISWRGAFTFRKISFRETGPVTITIGETASAESIDLDLVPPAVSPQKVTVSEDQRTENNRRLAVEDSIRRAYEATMVDESRGNYATIRRFKDEAANKIMADRLLQVISKKDLRDISLEVLRDNETSVTDTSALYCHYVLNPRVENEWLVPYKHFFRKQFAGIKNATQLKAWCQKYLQINDALNPQKLRMTPIGVYQQRKADRLSYKIFFVSVARSLGIPSRVNAVDGRLQYAENGSWIDVDPADKAETKAPQGLLRLTWHATPHLDDPKYYTHFTLSRIDKGIAQLLTYPDEATWSTTFKDGVSLEAGRYMLTTGTRLANGGVLAHVECFDVKAGQTTDVALMMRESEDDVQVIGSFNAENSYHDSQLKVDKSLLSTAGRGYYVIGIVAPNHEPTNHTLRDISACRDDFEKWGRKIMLLFTNETEARRFNHAEFGGLPSTVVWGTDVNGKILSEIREQFHLSADSQLPVFLIADSFNRVVAIWQGYTIGLGEQMLKVIRKL